MSNYWDQNYNPVPQDNVAVQPVPPQLPGIIAQPVQAAQPSLAPSYYPATPATAYQPPQQRYYSSPVQTQPKPAAGNHSHAWLIAVCILVSFVFGFGGSFISNQLTGTPDNGSINAPEVDPPDQVTGVETDSWSAVVDTTKDSVVEISTQAREGIGAGSGVIISADGYIITNDHVITGSSEIQVALTNGTTYGAKLIGTDPQTDIALIKISTTNLTPAVLGDSGSVKVGDKVIAIGNPLGSLGGTVTDGIVSALDREIQLSGQTMRLMQFSAAVNPGNSGGGLFNINGELIGVVNAKSTGEDIEGLGFAVPIDTAKEVVNRLMGGGYTPAPGRPSLGASAITISDAATANQYGVEEYGVYFVRIVEGGAADLAGIKQGDRVLTFDGKSIVSDSEIDAAVDAKKPGDQITIEIMRNGRTMTFRVTLQESASS